MNSDSIQDLLLQAMEIISNSVVKENNNKDITIWNCYITDDSNRKDGEYGVTDGSINFKAYSQYTEYKKSDYVAVVVPQGDYNNTKYIVQKVAADGSRLPYASPLDNYVQVTENLLTDFKTQTFNKTQKQVFLKTLDLTTYGTPKDTDKKNIYDTLIFSCDFKTYLSNSKKVKGKYGLIFTLNYRNEIGYPLQETITFDSTQFYGNPFNFVLPSTQSQGFALNETNSLTSVSIEFFQDLTLDESLNENLPIIELLNLNIGLGVNIAKNPDNTLKIYTSNSFDYDKNNNIKDIGLFWYNKNENNKYIGFEDGNFSSTYSEEKYVEEKRKYELYDIIAAKENAPLSQDGMDLAVDMVRLEDAYKIMLQDFAGLKTIVDQFNDALIYPLSELYVDEEETKTGKDFMDILCGKAEQANSLEQSYVLIKTVSEDIISKVNGILFDGKAINSYIYISPFPPLGALSKTILPFDNNNFISSKIAQDMKEFYPEYYHIYSEYCKKIQQYRDKISVTYYNKVQEIIGTDNQFENRINDWNSGQAYQKVAFSEEPYENYYCIYWYKDSPYHEDLILGKGWERLEDYDNYGKNETFKYSLDVLGSQRLRAVLFLNHQQYNSNILTFNLVTSDGSIIDPNAALSIKHGENSLNSYQFYDDNNYIMKISDTKVKRILYPSLSSSIGQTLNDFCDGEIYWSLPKNKTMLKYSKENENSMEYSFYEETENYCFYKKLPSSESLTLEDFSFVYLIDEYYDKHYSNNMIQCRIVKEFQEYKASTPITFSSLGKSDSEYSLVVTPYKNSGRALTGIKDFNNPGDVTFLVRLFDNAGKEISLQSTQESLYGELSCQFEVFKGPQFQLDGQDDQESLGKLLTLENTGNPTYGILHLSAIIYVKGGMKNDKENITIEKDYGIPYTTIENSYVDGMFSIIYSCFGNNPRYYKDPFKFYNGETDKEEEVAWSINVVSSSGNEQVPEFRDNILVPKNSWIKTYEDKDEEKTNAVLTQIVAQAKLGNEIVWYQPIIVDSEIQSYRLLEGWDGRFQINEEGGYILSNMLVAGTKDKNNNFTGVTLGNMEILERDFEEVKEESENNTPATQEESQSKSILKSGMFGFHKGESSFGFETDGTAFIGKNGKGRIKFDGNRGIIDMGTVKINSLPDEEDEDKGVKEESYFQISKKIKKQKEDSNGEEEEVDAMIFQVSPSKTQIGDELLQGGILRIGIPAQIKSETDSSTEDFTYFLYDKEDFVKNIPEGVVNNLFYLGRGGLAFGNEATQKLFEDNTDSDNQKKALDTNALARYSHSKMTSQGLSVIEYKQSDNTIYKMKAQYRGSSMNIGRDIEEKWQEQTTDVGVKGIINFNWEEEAFNGYHNTIGFTNWKQINFLSPVRFTNKIILETEENQEQFIFDFNKKATFKNSVTFAESSDSEEVKQAYIVDIEGRAKFEQGLITFLNKNGKDSNNKVSIEKRVDFEADKITFYQTNDSVYDEQGNLSQKNILVEFNPEVQFKHKVLFGGESSDNVYPNTQITFNAQTQFDQPVIFTQESNPEFNSETSFNKKTSFKPNMLNVFGDDVEPDTNYYSKNNNNVVLFNKITAFNQQVDFFSLADFKNYASFYNGACFEGPNGTTVAEFKGLTIFNGKSEFNFEAKFKNTASFENYAYFGEKASVEFASTPVFSAGAKFTGQPTNFESRVQFGEDEKTTYQTIFYSPAIFHKPPTFKTIVDFTNTVTFAGATFNKSVTFVENVSFQKGASFSTGDKGSIFFEDLPTYQNEGYFATQTWVQNLVTPILQENTNLKQNIATLETELEEANERYDNLSTSYDNLSTSYNSLSTSYSSLSKSYNTLRSNYNTLLSNYSTLSSDYDTLLLNYNALEQENKDLRDTVTTLRETITALRETIKDLEAQLEEKGE